MSEDFTPFPKILAIGKLKMSITQKIHGTNAQVYIYKKGDGMGFKVASRNRWITPEDDNYGFAKFVYEHSEKFIELLGLGVHFGEWAGPGINNGEGLNKKTFLLFNQRWIDKPLPPQTSLVPHLYTGAVSLSMIDKVFDELKTNGSKLVPGFMHSEGIVIDLNGKLYKRVFNPEETSWTSQKREDKKKVPTCNVDYLLQPMRLEKLLSRDEKYLREFPHSLSLICQDYVADLEEEGCFPQNPEELETVKKTLGRHIFPFVKEQILKE